MTPSSSWLSASRWQREAAARERERVVRGVPLDERDELRKDMSWLSSVSFFPDLRRSEWRYVKSR